MSKVNTHWNYVEKRYETILERKVAYHEMAVEAINEIHNEIDFETIYGEIVQRTTEQKLREIVDIQKRFLLDINEYDRYRFDLRNKVWRGTHNVAQGEVHIESNHLSD